jgi:DNA replication and repair protein RecF
MQVSRLSLTNFRNYGRLELDLPDGTTLLYGANAQGKTNLLEAIYYLATTRSPHVDQDQQLIHWEALKPEEPIVAARLVADISTSSGPKQIEMRLVKEQGRRQARFRREALVNRRKVRLMDLLGNLQVVLFLPEDVQIVTGSPAQRRRYLDITLCQSDHDYCRTLSAYNKVLEQRNALLRRIAEYGDGQDVLPIYTEKLVTLGSEIYTKRAAFVSALGSDAQRIHYEDLTDGQETLKLKYLPRLTAASMGRGNHAAVEEAVALGDWLLEQSGQGAVEERFHQSLTEARSAELAIGTTRVGPHRDDWRFWVSGRSLSSFGSRGQQRSSILALKLAEIHWMGKKTGETPVLLMYEVVAELDEVRRSLLLAAVQDSGQAILTASDPNMFSAEFLEQATTMSVTAGQVAVDDRLPIAS